MPWEVGRTKDVGLHVGSEHAARDVCVWSTLNIQHWAWEMQGKYHA